MALKATRLLQQPIIYPDMDSRMGDNICNPSIVRVPTWVANPLGRYYLYFSDHKGSYIRLAYAQALEGPWQLHEPGALDIVDSYFDPDDPPEPPEAARPAWAKSMKGGYLYAHIVSPDVHVDERSGQFLMYYHGLLANGDQSTRLAKSNDGLSYSALEPLLGPPYFRAFSFRDFVYVVTWGGEIWRASDWEGPFEQGPQLIHYDAKEGVGEGFRHGESHRVGSTLYILYTRMGDCPERIVYVTVELNDNWSSWRASEPVELLSPELEWEGADLPEKISTMGSVPGRLRELRDPCVFVDADGSTYLLYCGACESGIGLARLEGF